MKTITATDAATIAKVTVATIRDWCRRGVIAATKAAGRWAVDAASLTRRIAIGNHQTEARLQRVQAVPYGASGECFRFPRLHRGCGHVRYILHTRELDTRSVPGRCSICKAAQEETKPARTPGPRPTRPQISYLNSLARKAKASNALPSDFPLDVGLLDRAEASNWIDTLKSIVARTAPTHARARSSYCECPSGRFGGVCTCC